MRPSTVEERVRAVMAAFTQFGAGPVAETVLRENLLGVLADQKAAVVSLVRDVVRQLEDESSREPEMDYSAELSGRADELADLARLIDGKDFLAPAEEKA